MQEKRSNSSISKLPKIITSQGIPDNIIKISDDTHTSLKTKPELYLSTNLEISPRYHNKINSDKMSSSSLYKPNNDILRTQDTNNNTNKPSFLSISTEKFYTDKSNKINTNSSSIINDNNINKNKNSNSSNSGNNDYVVKDFYLTNFMDHKKFKDNKSHNLVLGISEDFNTYRLHTEGSSLKNLNGLYLKEDLPRIQTTRAITSKFFDSLPASIRTFYADKKEYIKTCDDIDVAVYCLDEIIDRVKCYRYELGIVLEKIEVTFKKIMEKLLETSMKYFSDKDQTYEKRMKENLDGIEKLNIEKLRLEEQNKHFQSLINLQKSEFNIYQLNLNSMENEIKLLHELLKKDFLLAEKNKANLETEKSNIEMLRKFKEANEIKPPAELLESGLVNLQDSIFNLEKEQYNKGTLLQSMNNLLKAMLKGGKQDVSTQVEEGELAWRSKHLFNNDDLKPKQNDIYSYDNHTVNIEGRIKEYVDNNKAITNLDPIEILNIKEKEKQNQINNEDQSAAKELLRAKSNTGPQLVQQDVNLQWNLPLSMIVFMENITRTGDTANVLPWPYFRRIIFDIYNDRIANSNELNYSILGSFMQMNEYTCLYFVKIHKLRRLAEIKLLEFLVSLKYYVKIWPRALIFANLCNMLSKQGAPVEGSDISDSFSLTFFLFAYSKLTSDTSIFLEHQEGSTWLPKEKLDEMTKEILIFENEANRKKFIANVQKQLRFITDTSGREGDCIDIDKLLLAYIEAYKEARQRNIKTLSKNFYKQYPNGEGVFSFEEFTSTISEVFDVEILNPNYTFPKELTISRAFMHSLTGNKNAFSIVYKDFAQSCSKFGLDCPFPFISTSFLNQVAAMNSFSNSVYNSTINMEKGMIISGPGDKKSGNLTKKGKEIPRPSAVKDSKKISDNEENAVYAGKYEKKKRDGESNQQNTPLLKIDPASALFAQHFSILRELRTYCLNFKEMMKIEASTDALWKGFTQILQILETGCQFLSMPINS